MRTRVKIETVAGAIDEVDVVKSMVKSVKRPSRSCREVEFVSKRLPRVSDMYRDQAERLTYVQLLQCPDPGSQGSGKVIGRDT